MTIPQHSICLQPYNPEKVGYARRWQIDRARLSETILKSVWSPIVWAKGHRTRENFKFADWLVLDFDDGELPLENAINNTFCDMIHLIGTTRSHTPEAPRFRVCIPFERRINEIDLYEGNLAFYSQKHGSDPKPTTGAYPFFPCREIIAKKTEGEFATVYDKKRKQGEPWDGQITALSRFALSVISQKIVPTGERDTTAFRLAKDFLKSGMDDDQALGALKKIGFTPMLSDHYLMSKVRAAHKHLRRPDVKKEKSHDAKAGTTPNYRPVDGHGQRP